HRADLAAVDDIRESPDVLRTLTDALRAAGLTHGRVGLVGEVVVPYFWQRQIADALPEVDWVRADALMDQAKRVKSPAEQALIRRVAALAKRTVDAMLASAVPGQT